MSWSVYLSFISNSIIKHLKLIKIELKLTIKNKIQKSVELNLIEFSLLRKER